MKNKCDVCPNPVTWKVKGKYYCYPHMLAYDQFGQHREELIPVRIIKKEKENEN